MSRADALAAVEALVFSASETLAHDAEIADRLLGEALARFSTIPAGPYEDGVSLAAARQLAAAVEAFNDRLEREKARVSDSLDAIESGRVATNGYGAASRTSRFARVG